MVGKEPMSTPSDDMDQNPPATDAESPMPRWVTAVVGGLLIVLVAVSALLALTAGE
jgi:hypothetical protein